MTGSLPWRCLFLLLSSAAGQVHIPFWSGTATYTTTTTTSALPEAPDWRFKIGVCADGETQSGIAASIDKFHQMQMNESTRLVAWRHLNRTGDILYDFRETACNATLAQEVGEEMLANVARPKVLIGCTCDATTDVTARIGAVMKVPQISFTAGARAFSADKTFYTYFMRTVPPLRGVPKHIIRLLQHFQWTKAKFIALWDARPGSNLIEEDMFYQTAEIAEREGVALTRIGLDVGTLNTTEPVDGACTAPRELSADGERCEDLTKWREALHNGRVLPELIHIACIYDPKALVALRLAAEEKITKHVWIFDALASVLETQRALGQAAPVDATTLAALEGSLNLKSLVPETEVWEKYRNFVPEKNRPDIVYAPRFSGGPPTSYNGNYKWDVPSAWAWSEGNGTSTMYNEMELVDALLTMWAAFDKLLDGLHQIDIKEDVLYQAMLNVSIPGTRGLVTYDHLGDIRLEGEALELFNRRGGQWVSVGRLDMSSGLQLQSGEEIVWPDGTTEVPDDTRPACNRDKGEYYDGLSCIPCGPGQGLSGTLPGSTDGFDSFCEPCFPGNYSTEGVCQQCMPGRWAWAGAIECDACDPGRFRPPGSKRGCGRCEKGSFAIDYGASACVTCKRGRYAAKSGSSICQDCPMPAEMMTTYQTGSQSVTECVCFAGFYHPCEGEACLVGASKPQSVGFCEPCPAGMTCTGNRLNPNAMFDKLGNDTVEFVLRHKAPYWPQGYMAIGKTAYACGQQADGVSCLGAKMGANVSAMCAPFSSGVACAECAEGYAYQDGECKLCNTRGIIGVAVLAVLAVVMLVCLFFFTFPREPHGTLTKVTFEGAMHTDVLSNTLAAGVNLLQTTWLFAKAASIHWPRTTQALFTSSGDAWDLSIFSLECYFDRDPRGFAVNRTIILNALPALPIAILAGAWTVGKVGRKKAEAKGLAYFPDPCQACSMGLSILSTCFLVIANAAINCGFAEFPHPGGQRSLSYFPYLLTTDSEVSAIRVVSVMGILSWCVCAMAWVVVLLMRMPSKLRDVQYRRSTLSITSRFRPQYPWWFLLQLLLNLLIAMTPSLFMSGEAQLSWMCVVFTLYLALVASFRPYFCPVTYYCDCTCTFGKLVILLLVVPYQCSGEMEIQVLIGIVAVLVYAIACGEILYALMLWAQYNLRGKPREIEKEWDNLGGKLAKRLKLPYTSSMMDLVDLVMCARPSFSNSTPEQAKA